MIIGVCEDDPSIRRLLAEALRFAGHETVMAHDGGEALRRFGADSAIDVMVVDIGLPDSDGRDVCQALRSAGQNAPSSSSPRSAPTHERLAGFGAGGDDYVAKPFELKELIARLEALGRRGRPPLSTSVRPRAGPGPARRAYAVGRGAADPDRVPDARRHHVAPDEVVRRRTVIAAAWPEGAVVAENTVDSFMRRIRTKLESIDSPVSIETVRGVGFRIR